jgi:predicted amidohydrolase YtcJ
VQHRGGALWVLNSAALARTGAAGCPLPGVERDTGGAPTGRLWRMDRWLAGVVPAVEPDLAAVGRRAAAYGVTGFTDATPDRRDGELRLLVEAARSGALPQRLTLMRPATVPSPIPAPVPAPAGTGSGVGFGPVKLMLDDPTLPALDELAERIRAAHAGRIPVAVHCVTRVQLVVTLAAFGDAGTLPGDRIEHAAVVPPELVPTIAALRLTVVTQPNFVAERGDAYLAEVDPDDLDCLYPCASLQAVGIAVAAGTDAPFGHPDPWPAVRAAIERRTASGRRLGAAERVPPGEALGLFLGSARHPGLRRTVRPASPADLCLLRVPLAVALAEPKADLVAATFIGGRPVK